MAIRGRLLTMARLDPNLRYKGVNTHYKFGILLLLQQMISTSMKQTISIRYINIPEFVYKIFIKSDDFKSEKIDI